jgi:hypothetical protein
MPKFDAKKTGISFITFLGSWAVRLFREHLANSKLDYETCIYNVSSRAVHAYFRKKHKNSLAILKGEPI